MVQSTGRSSIGSRRTANAARQQLLVGGPMSKMISREDEMTLLDKLGGSGKRAAYVGNWQP